MLTGTNGMARYCTLAASTMVGSESEPSSHM